MAQPPFSMKVACWYVPAFFSSTMFVAASALLWNCWTETVGKMVHVMGAPITEDDQKQIITYLSTNYSK